MVEVHWVQARVGSPLFLIFILPSLDSYSSTFVDVISSAFVVIAWSPMSFSVIYLSCSLSVDERRGGNELHYK
jgi:hypothetical protein